MRKCDVHSQIANLVAGQPLWAVRVWSPDFTAYRSHRCIADNRLASRGGCVAELVEIGVAASPAERGYLFRQQGQCIEGLALLPTFAIRPLCAW